MERPEYWESDERWACYESQLAENPPVKQEPMTALATAIKKASEPDIVASIHLLNEMSRIMHGHSNSKDD